jgi:hypothetical protein
MFDGVRQAATVSDDEQEEPFWRKAPAMHLKGHISEVILSRQLLGASVMLMKVVSLTLTPLIVGLCRR